MHRLAAIFLTLLLAGSLAACGDDDTDTSAPGDNNAPEAPSNNEGEDETDAEASGNDPSGTEDEAASDSGEAGTVTIDGTTYAMNSAMSCNAEGAPFDADLELAVLGSSAAGFVQLDVFLADFMGSDVHEVSWSGPEGIFSTSLTDMGGSWSSDNDEIYSDSPISVGTDRVTGSLTVWDMDQETSVDLDFDVVVPAQEVACR